MKDSQIKNKTSGINPAVAAVAGAVAGGVAVAGAIIMSNKDNQDKVKKAVSNVKDGMNAKKREVVDKANKVEDIAKNAVKDTKNL